MVLSVVKRTENVDAVVGGNIKTLRVARGLSQEQLSEQVAHISGAPMHQQTVLKIESGQRPLRFMEAKWFALVLDVPVGALGEGTEVVALAAELTRRLARVEGTHQELIDLTRRLGDEMLDLAVGLSQNLRMFGDSEAMGSVRGAAEIQLRADFGADVNEVLMEQLAPCLSDKKLKPEFKSDTYTQALARIAGAAK